MTNDSSEKAQLAQLRERIDDIDIKIGDLISERANCALEVAQVKRQFSGGVEPTFYRPEREAQVLRQAMVRNQGPLGDEEYARLFREIMSACLALEQPVKVAYLGPEGTFTQQAAIKHFGHAAQTVSMPAIDEVFREVEAGAARFGVVPVENSTGGVVDHTFDSFVGSKLKICGEVVLRIHHHLMVSEVTSVNEISRIYSHSQSFAQCRKWLDNYYPNAEKIAVTSNGDAAKRIKSEWNSAAIAGQMAAELYELNVLSQNIEDQPDNSTRFLIIGDLDVGVSGDDKTSVLVSLRNEPGALHQLLEPFQRHKIDLTRLETRPSPTGPWNYVFFVDMVGHQSDPNVSAALDEIAQRVADLKVLGSYPRGVL